MSDEQLELLPTVLRHLFTAERQPTGFLAAGENGASAEDNGRWSQVERALILPAGSVRRRAPGNGSVRPATSR